MKGKNWTYMTTYNTNNTSGFTSTKLQATQEIELLKRLIYTVNAKTELDIICKRKETKMWGKMMHRYKRICTNLTSSLPPTLWKRWLNWILNQRYMQIDIAYLSFEVFNYESADPCRKYQPGYDPNLQLHEIKFKIINISNQLACERRQLFYKKTTNCKPLIPLFTFASVCSMLLLFIICLTNINRTNF